MEEILSHGIQWLKFTVLVLVWNIGLSLVLIGLYIAWGLAIGIPGVALGAALGSISNGGAAIAILVAVGGSPFVLGLVTSKLIGGYPIIDVSFEFRAPE